MRAPFLAFLLAVALCGLSPGGASAGDAGLSAEYGEAIRLYARGEHAKAIAEVARLGPEHLSRQMEVLEIGVRRLARCPTCPDPVKLVPLRAAVMLHVDLDEAERAAGMDLRPPRVCPAGHARLAARIAAFLAERDPRDDFARRFFLGMAQRSQWYFCLEDAQEWGRDGLKLFPRDAALLESMAAALEEDGVLWTPRESSIVASHRKAMEARAEAEKERTNRFVDAARLLSQAVDADPSSSQARVRLGRVLWRLGRADEARKTLEEALRRGGPAPSPYLAHLCLGQLHAGAGRTPEAIREFSEALALDPQSQAAAVGLSEVLLRTGDGARARSVLEQALSYAGRRTIADAHWRAVASNTTGMKELFAELRRETLE